MHPALRLCKNYRSSDERRIAHQEISPDRAAITPRMISQDSTGRRSSACGATAGSGIVSLASTPT